MYSQVPECLAMENKESHQVFAVAGQASHTQECYLHSSILAQVSNLFGWQCWPIPAQACACQIHHPVSKTTTSSQSHLG